MYYNILVCNKYSQKIGLKVIFVNKLLINDLKSISK